MTTMYSRLISPQDHSFFLFGPRSTGKTTWLRQHYKDALWFNLLRNAEYLDLIQDKGLFRRRVESLDGGWVVIDEVQRLPELLNEVHDLISTYQERYLFALSGSSARKLRRGGVNLLAGRVFTRNLFPLVSKELDFNFEIEDALRFGMLPDVHRKSKHAKDFLKSYVTTYLREEIQQEALTRNLDAFTRFLSIAAIMNGEIINIAGVSRDSGVGRTTCQNYFQILIDTLVGYLLPAWQPRAKVRESGKPKFYLFDPGVANTLAGNLSFTEEHAPTRGKLLETLLLSELRALSDYLLLDLQIFYWQGSSNKEVDFIVKQGSITAGIEVKCSKKWRNEYSKTLLELPLDKRYVVYLGETEQTYQGVRVMPLMNFLKELYAHKGFK